MRNKSEIPIDAYDLEVFSIKGKEAYIGFKIPNGNFHFIQVPYTEKVNREHLELNDFIEDYLNKE